MNEIIISVKRADIQEALKTIEELQKGMDTLGEESTDLELKTAYHNYGIAHRYIRCLRDLKLLPEPEYSRLFMRQLKISERIMELQEKKGCEKLENTR